MGKHASKYNVIHEVKEDSPSEVLRASSIQPPANITVGKRFIEKWANNPQDVMWDVTFHSKGVFHVFIGITNKENHGEAVIEVEINGMVLTLTITPEMYYPECTKIFMGALAVNNPGFSIIRVRAKEEEEGAIGRLYFIEVKGPAIDNLNIHSWDVSSPLAASDVYLVWHSKSTNINMFYNEMCIADHNTDALFIACGFFRGYIGFLEGRVVFEIENPGLDASAMEEVPKRYVIKDVRHAFGARIESHSNQTRASCSYYYQWKPDTTYRFLLTAKHSDVENSVFYSGFFYKNETNEWTFLATFKAVDMQRLFSELYSSVEKCKSYHGFNNYEAIYGPAMVHIKDKGWAHLVRAQFQQREDGDFPTDVNAGVKDNKLFLSTGHPAKKTVPLYESVACERANLPDCLVNFDPESFNNSSSEPNA